MLLCLHILLFSAINAEPDVAGLHEAAPGAAWVVVDRIPWDKEVPATAVRLSYAPGYRGKSRI